MGTSDLSQLKMPFPWKLHHMLEEAEKKEGGFTNVVSWLPDGKAFKIYDETTFVSTVMKTYFNQTKIKSFTRQLYIYGFLKIPSGPNEGAFYHPEFIRNNKESCFSLRRNQAGDRRRTKVNRRGSASSVTSTSSFESYDSGVQQLPPNFIGSTKAKRRSSLSDYVCGKPTHTPMPRRGSIGAGSGAMAPQQQYPRVQRRSSLGAMPVNVTQYQQHPTQEIHNPHGANPAQMGQGDFMRARRRNSLSEFFEQALTMLPEDQKYAALPCLDAIDVEPTPIGANPTFVTPEAMQQTTNPGMVPPELAAPDSFIGMMNQTAMSGSQLQNTTMQGDILLNNSMQNTNLQNNLIQNNTFQINSMQMNNMQQNSMQGNSMQNNSLQNDPLQNSFVPNMNQSQPPIQDIIDPFDGDFMNAKSLANDSNGVDRMPPNEISFYSS